MRSNRPIAVGALCACLVACSLVVDVDGSVDRGSVDQGWAAEAGVGADDGAGADASAPSGGPRTGAGDAGSASGDGGAEPADVADAAPRPEDAAPRPEDAAPRPEDADPPNPCGLAGCIWDTGEWSDCDEVCGEGEVQRTVQCTTLDGTRVDDDLCESRRPDAQMTVDCTASDVRRVCEGEAVWAIDGCDEMERVVADCARAGGCADGACQCDTAPPGHICCRTPAQYHRYAGCISVQARFNWESFCPGGVDDMEPDWIEEMCP